uniref:Uncharacterized protein n=1 Tax=Anas platyrhynchos TaxID=8839 RepID=A0A8B9TMF5_ANAPL
MRWQWNKEMLEGCEKGFVAAFQESLRSLSHNLGELQCLSNQVLQKGMDHATTAPLPYQLPWMPGVVVRSSVTWLRSYIKLFQAPCQRCRKFLQDGLLPVWRDFQTLGAFRDTCRQ